jgi:putative serine protease PepD
MGFEDEGDEHEPAAGPLPPDDRLWRHPSELVGAAGPTPLPPTEETSPNRRTLALAALASACLTGAVTALALAWLTSPAEVATRRTTDPPQADSATFGEPTTWPVLQSAAGPWLARVVVQHRDGPRHGSGVWTDAEGTLVVPERLLRGATDLEVVDHLGNAHRSRVHAVDEATGIAVLRVAEAAPTAPLATPNTATRVGIPVAVVGSAAPDRPGGPPRQPAFARTSVAAMNQRATIDREVLHGTIFLRDRLDPALVGAVAVDLEGRPVALVLEPDHPDGRALAVPLSEVVSAAQALRDSGEVRRPWLGVRASDASTTPAALDDPPGGAVLTRVSAGSPAAAAGLRSGDVVVQVDAQVVRDASDLVLALRSCDPGQEVSIEVRREGQPLTVEAKLAG